MKRRIDFVIVGAQKSGTTALHSFLTAHPQISMPASKEMHFFNRTSWVDFHMPLWRDRKRHLYHRRFPDFPNPSKVYGEATPHYMTWNVALDRIQQYNPEIRVMAVLRHPVDRAYSHWNMERQRGETSLSFQESVDVEVRQESSEEMRPDQVYSFLRRGFYVPQIQALWSRFGHDRVLLLKHADLLLKHHETLDKVFAFLGVPSVNVVPQEVHSRPYETPMPYETRESLLNMYQEDVVEVECLLGWDCSDWKV